MRGGPRPVPRHHVTLGIIVGTPDRAVSHLQLGRDANVHVGLDQDRDPLRPAEGVVDERQTCAATIGRDPGLQFRHPASRGARVSRLRRWCRAQVYGWICLVGTKAGALKRTTSSCSGVVGAGRPHARTCCSATAHQGRGTGPSGARKHSGRRCVCRRTNALCTDAAGVGIWDMDFATGVVSGPRSRVAVRPGAGNIRRDVRGVRQRVHPRSRGPPESVREHRQSVRALPSTIMHSGLTGRCGGSPAPDVSSSGRMASRPRRAFPGRHRTAHADPVSAGAEDGSIGQLAGVARL